MNNHPFWIFYTFILLISFILNGCSQVRESAGVNRKVANEYTITRDPPLSPPPDYNLLPSEQIIERKQNNESDELIKEILLGLDNNESGDANLTSSSALNSILDKRGASQSSPDLRRIIVLDYANLLSTKYTFAGEKYMTEEEILDAFNESKRIRENLFNEKGILEGDTPVTTRPNERGSFLRNLF